MELPGLTKELEHRSRQVSVRIKRDDGRFVLVAFPSRHQRVTSVEKGSVAETWLEYNSSQTESLGGASLLRFEHCFIVKPVEETQKQGAGIDGLRLTRHTDLDRLQPAAMCA